MMGDRGRALARAASKQPAKKSLEEMVRESLGTERLQQLADRIDDQALEAASAAADQPLDVLDPTFRDVYFEVEISRAVPSPWGSPRILSAQRRPWAT